MRRIIGTVAVLSTALLVAGGGAATAAKLVTSSDIKNGTIKSADLSSSAKRALKGRTGVPGAPGARGPQGPQGAPGPQGPAGPSAVSGLTYAPSAQVRFGSAVVQSATAKCPAGQRVVMGGGGVVGDTMNVSGPLSDRSGWLVAGTDFTDEGGEYVQAYAWCAPANAAVAAGARPVQPKSLRALEKLHAHATRE